MRRPIEEEIPLSPPKTFDPVAERALAACDFVGAVAANKHLVAKRLFGSSAEEQTDHRLDLDREAFAQLVDEIVLVCAEEIRRSDLAEVTARSWISQSLKNCFINVLTYQDYVTAYHSASELAEFMDIIREAKESGSVDGLLQFLVYRSPLIGGITTHLYGSISDQASPFNQKLLSLDPPRPVAGWYCQLMEEIAQLHDQISRFFAKLEARCNVYDRELKHFLPHWRQDLELVVIECVNLANCFAIGAWGSAQPIWIYWPSFPRPSGQTDSQLRDAILPMVYPNMREALGDLFSDKTFSKSDIPIPIAISHHDLIFFVPFLKEHMATLVESLRFSGTPGGGGKYKVKLGNDCTAICHPYEEFDHEARISLSSSNPIYNGFSLRVDQERRGRLCFDFGHITFEKALAYAKVSIAKIETLPPYAETVDQNGNLLLDHPIFDRLSEMQWAAGLSKGERATLIAAILANCGALVGTRKGRFLGHHFRENVSENVEPSNFPSIVQQFRSVLMRRQ